MRVLVCGGRDFSDRDRLFAEMNAIHAATSITWVIVGGSTGADYYAWRWASAADALVECYPAQWKKLGKSAGPIRNQYMLDHDKPDLVVAFPGGRGTADMVRRAQAAGVKVIFPLNNGECDV